MVHTNTEKTLKTEILSSQVYSGASVQSSSPYIDSALPIESSHQNASGQTTSRYEARTLHGSCPLSPGKEAHEDASKRRNDIKLRRQFYLDID